MLNGEAICDSVFIESDIKSLQSAAALGVGQLKTFWFRKQAVCKPGFRYLTFTEVPFIPPRFRLDTRLRHRGPVVLDHPA